MSGPDHPQLRSASVSAQAASPRLTVLALLATAPTILRLGWSDPLLDPFVLQSIQLGLIIVYGADLFLLGARSLPASLRREFLRATRPERALVIASIALGWWFPLWLAITAGGLTITHMLRLYLRLVQTKAIPPGLVFVGSFIVLIAIGTGALLLPSATPPGQPITLTDAAFTITSAISQTGLVVRPTGEGFTRFGQVIILVWIQVGALGVIVFGALVATVIGSSFGLRATQTIAEGTEQGWAGQLSLQRLVAFIIIFTHLAELIGAGILYVSWPQTWVGGPGMGAPLDRFYHCVFFSVSAFCNAGFATTANSMQGLRTHWTPHLVLVPLIILGSIGFPVLENMLRTFWARLKGRRIENGALIRLNLNTKIVLMTTLVVYVIGFLVIWAGEMAQASESISQGIGAAALDAHFMNINRTAGFDTIPVSDMGPLGRLMLLALMFIGGSPGSVAGGIKIMALAVLSLTVWSTITGRRETVAFGRTLPDELVRKCAVVVALSLATILVVGGVLAAVETGPDGRSFEELIFETVSAFGTCGFSMGITADLSPVGKAAIMTAMFVGRVGPLAVTAALLAAATKIHVRYSYPVESVVIY